jgi:hypothetical protein
VQPIRTRHYSLLELARYTLTRVRAALKIISLLERATRYTFILSTQLGIYTLQFLPKEPQLLLGRIIVAYDFNQAFTFVPSRKVSTSRSVCLPRVLSCLGIRDPELEYASD